MKKKILIVEDDSCIRNLLVEAFLTEGFDVMNASNGQEALNLLEESIPDLILLDLMMPLMCGRQFRKEQLANPRLQVIPTLSMSAQSLDQEEISGLGFEHFLPKPLELNELLHKAQKLMTASIESKLMT